MVESPVGTASAGRDAVAAVAFFVVFVEAFVAGSPEPTVPVLNALLAMDVRWPGSTG